MVIPGQLQKTNQTYWDLLYLSFFCSFSPEKVGHLDVCVLLRLSERWLEAAVVVGRRMRDVN